MVERCARAIAGGLGYDFDTLYANKGEWTRDRGARHDISTPLKPDFTEAARAVIEALMEPTPEMLSAARAAPMPMVMLDSVSARQDLEFKSKLQAALRTALSQPNDEGEGK